MRNRYVIFVLSVFALGLDALTAGMTADFSKEIGPVRRELHSSGYSPKIDSNGNLTEQIKSMNFDYVRTLIPDDFDKMVEVFAGIIRHYTRGWADVKVIAGRGEASLQNGRLNVSIPEKLDYIWVRRTHLIEQ